MSLDFIILAAGKGKRMKNYKHVHKTLLEINGISLLGNHLIYGSDYINNLLNDIIVVVGHRKEEVEKEIEKLNSKLNTKIKTVEGDLRGTKYGRSLYKALLLSESEHIMYVMGDHWISYEQLGKKYPIRKLYSEYSSYQLTIFADPNPLIANSKSQSLLYVKNGKILDYGKELKRYTHVDMGLFLGKKNDLVDIIKKRELSKNDFDTKDLIEALLDVTIVEIEDVPWFGCNTPEDYESGLKKLYRLKNTK